MNTLQNFLKKYSKWIFVIYMAVLILVIILKLPTSLVIDTFKRWMEGESTDRLQPQLIPFKTIVFYIQNVQAVYDWFFKNLAANILMFMPFGFLCPFLMKKEHRKGWRVALAGCLLSTFIEIFQYVAAIGQCDVDDVILNVIGVCIGYEIYKLMYFFTVDISEAI